MTASFPPWRSPPCACTQSTAWLPLPRTSTRYEATAEERWQTPPASGRARRRRRKVTSGLCRNWKHEKDDIPGAEKKTRSEKRVRRQEQKESFINYFPSYVSHSQDTHEEQREAQRISSRTMMTAIRLSPTHAFEAKIYSLKS